MGPRDRRDRERLETRERILGAAREMFADEGYEAVTMRAIADRIEYTPTAIYHHFENKQALVTELCTCDFDGLAEHFLKAASMTDPVQRIWTIGEAYLQFAAEHPNHYRFMFMTVLPEVAHSDELVAQRRGNPDKDAYSFLRRTCQEAIDQGRLRADLSDADEVAQILWASLHGLISLRIVKSHHDWVPWRDLRATARHAMEAMFRGILRDPPK